MVGAGAIKEACGWVDIVHDHHDHHHYPEPRQTPSVKCHPVPKPQRFTTLRDFLSHPHRPYVSLFNSPSHNIEY